MTDGTTAYGSQVAFELDALGSSVNNIVGSQISAGANIADSALAVISTAGKVSGAALTLLANIPSGAGVIPAVNLGAAVQADMEAQTAAKMVDAAMMKFSPCSAKAWVRFDGTGANPITVTSQYNVTGTVTKNGTGDYTITWDTDFSDTAYAIFGQATYTGNLGQPVLVLTKTIAAGTLNILTVKSDTGLVVDCDRIYVVCFGDQ